MRASAILIHLNKNLAVQKENGGPKGDLRFLALAERMVMAIVTVRVALMIVSIKGKRLKVKV